MFKKYFSELYHISDELEKFVDAQVKIMTTEVNTSRNKKGSITNPNIVVKGIVEISRYNILKIENEDEYSKDGVVRPHLDRIVPIRFANYYGYIPNTKEEDGDCIDTYILIPDYLDANILNYPGLSLDLIPLLTLVAKDNDQVDNKVICIPVAFYDHFFWDTKHQFDFLAQILNIVVQFYRYKPNCHIEDIIGFEDTLEYLKAKKL